MCDGAIDIVAFSKGCVVLNQLMWELTAIFMMPKQEHLKELISRLRHLYWLDGGHNGERHLYITEQSVIDGERCLCVLVLKELYFRYEEAPASNRPMSHTRDTLSDMQRTTAVEAARRTHLQ